MARKSSGAGHGTQALFLKKNYCFACGQDNPLGMHLKFVLAHDRKRFICNFRLGRRYTGPPGYCHGGIIATILDDAMSKLNKLRGVIAATKEMKVEYRKPVPLHTALHVEGKEIGKRGRQLIRLAEISDEKGTVLARSRGVFVIINPQQVFRRKRP